MVALTFIKDGVDKKEGFNPVIFLQSFDIVNYGSRRAPAESVALKLGISTVTTAMRAAAFTLEVGDAAAILVETEKFGMKLRRCELLAIKGTDAFVEGRW